jgi:hypothetical protein
LNIFADTTRIADAIAIGNAPLITGQPLFHFSISIHILMYLILQANGPSLQHSTQPLTS